MSRGGDGEFVPIPDAVVPANRVELVGLPFMSKEARSGLIIFSGHYLGLH